MKKTGIKITILLPNLAGGGAERITVNLANELILRGYSIDMLLISATGPYINMLNPKINIIDFKSNRIRKIILPLWYYLKKENPDILLACMWPLTFISLIVKKMAFVNTKVFVAEHITWSKALIEYGFFIRLLIPTTMRLFFPWANGIIAVSKGAASNLASFANINPNSITTIYNPVVSLNNKFSKPSVAINENKWTKAKVKILTVGHLKEQKNHDLMIRAFSILLKKIDAHLLILGEGNLRSKLEKQIHDLGISDHVSLPGFTNDPFLYYRDANLFVLSSDWEGLPTVLIEALAAGVPIVSTDCPSGPREILEGGKFGRLVPVGDHDILAENMLDAISIDHDKCALKKRALKFSIEHATDQYEKLFLMN